MNKAQLVELFGVYEKGLASKARNKSAENAFVSGLYSFYGRGARPQTANNIRPVGKKTAENFNRNIRGLIKALQDPGVNAAALANANKKARQAAVNYYYSTTNAATTIIAMLKAARALVPPKAKVNIDSLFTSLVAEAAKVAPARNRLRRPLGPRKYPPGYMQNFPLPNGLTMKNFKTKLNSMNTKWTSEQNLKRMVQATLQRKYGNSFYTKYPNFASGPFRNIMNRATNTKKRFQPGSSRPSITASNAQFQALKALSPNGKTYYGNMPIWKALTPAQVAQFTNLTNIQKNALKRMIRSVRLNNMESNKSKVRVGRNREELSNNLMKMASNRNLLNVIKVRVAKRRANVGSSSPNTSSAKGAEAPKKGNAPAAAAPNRPSLYNMMGLN
jgi:hypothetical protein